MNKENVKITIAYDPARTIWRVEVVQGDECYMSRVAHSKEELEDLKIKALALKTHIQKQMN